MSAACAQTIKAGWRRPLPVQVRINDTPEKPWRINMMPVGDGSFYLYLHASVRGTAGVKVGDKVTVDVGFDPRYRGGAPHAAPPWFTRALRENPPAKANWAALPPSRKKEILRNFARLKSQPARARNLEKALQVLSGATGRFMARQWVGGR